MEDRFAAAHPRTLRDPRPEHVVLGEGHAPGVLHRPGRELRHEELVVLAEHVRIAEALFEEVEPLARELEDLVLVQVLHQRLPAVEAEGNAAVVLVDRVIMAGHDRREVCRHRLGRGEGPHRAFTLAWRVRHHDPIRWGLDFECVGRLQVGLVEAREHSVRVVAGELAVQVDAAIDWVLKPVQPGPVMHVARGGRDGQRVLVRQARELQPAAFESCGWQRLAVELGSRDRRSYELDERGRFRPAASKGDRRVRPERLVAVGEVQPDVVMDVGDEHGPLLRLPAGQVVADDDGLV